MIDAIYVKGMETKKTIERTKLEEALKGTMLEGENYEPSVELFQNLETNATLKLIAAIQKQRAHQRN